MAKFSMVCTARAALARAPAETKCLGIVRARLPWSRLLHTAILVLAVCWTHVSHAQSFRALGSLPGFATPNPLPSNPTVSADGSVIAGSVCCDASGNPRAVRWNNAGAIVNLGALAGVNGPPFSFADRVNANAAAASPTVIAGASSYDLPIRGQSRQAVRWDNDVITRLPFLPNGLVSTGNGVSGNGAVVVGSHQSIMPDGSNGPLQAVRWVNGAIFNLGVLPGDTQSTADAANADGSVIVGASCSNNITPVCQAFRWSSTTGMSGLGFLAGSFVSTANDVSADGSVVVGSSCNVTNITTCQAFRWTQSTGMTRLASGQAFAVSTNGQVVVGEFMDSNTGSSLGAFVWTITGAQSVASILTQAGVNLAGWTLTAATGVSADGTVVVGFGTRNGQTENWMATLPLAAPTLVVTPATDIAAAGKQGGPFLPSAFQYQLSATLGNLPFSISGTPIWLTPSVTSGTATTSPTIVTFTVNANANTLAPGTYGPVVITFANTTNGRGNTTRTATLTVSAGMTAIVSAVLPNARTTTVGKTVTAFATIINIGTVTANACSIALPGGVPANFLYQTTDPASNTPTGTSNTPVDIPPGQGQTFYFAITPTAIFSQDIPLVFACANAGAALVVPGLNTFLLSVSNTPVADMLSIADTLTRDGNMTIPGTGGTGLMVAASINIGAAATVTFTPTDTATGQPARNLPLLATICQTNPSTGQCINPTIPGPSTTVTVASNQTVTFTIFVQGQGIVVPYDPANNRIFIIAKQGATPVGEASVAVKMQ